MKQILQHLDNGQIVLAEQPAPRASHGRVIVRTRASVISAGTERMLLEFGKAGWLDKARQQPDKVRQVLDKIRTDGLVPTLQAVQSKLTQPIPLGYSSAGVVVEVGPGVTEFKPGDRVVSNGPHAEIVSVPQNLCAKLPDGAELPDEQAAFTVLASIALQGVRLAAPTLGETFVVTGLGLIGLLAVQLLRANGCKVVGIDIDPAKLARARALGAETVDPSAGESAIEKVHVLTRGRGVDGVLLAASTTSNEPVHEAAEMCRKRGRIVLVGAVGLELSRADFYEKELTFQVSCSYGPGRYDPEYEERGHDYPFGFVRWTERRNFEAVLELMADGSLDVASLITHRIPFERAPEAYELLSGQRDALGIVLGYAAADDASEARLLARRIVLPGDGRPAAAGQPRIGLIGSGTFTAQVLLPAMKKCGAELRLVASQGGMTAAQVGRKFGFAEATTEAEQVFGEPTVDTVIVTTRPDSHAAYVRRALDAGKHVFVEKPLAIRTSELDELERHRATLARPPLIGIGFNRRFAPLVTTAKRLVDGVAEPKTMVMTVNAGVIPLTHWTHDPDVAGGRIIHEACHFIDLLRFMAGAPITAIQAMILGGEAPLAAREDKLTLTLGFADGSIGTIHYFSNGHRSFPKERLEVFAAGRILALDNFKTLVGYGWPGFRKQALWNQDKGHAACISAFLQAVREGGPAPIPFEEIAEVTRASFRAVELVRGAPV